MRLDGGDISYNGWTDTLTRVPGGSAMDGFVVERANFSDVDAIGYLEKKALADGLDANDIFLGARRLDIDVSVYGSTRASFFDRADEFLAAFHPTLAYANETAVLGFRAFKFRQPTTDTASWSQGSIPMQMNLRPVAPPTYSIERDSSGGEITKGMGRLFKVSLIARDPRKYAQETVDITQNSSTLSSYRGNYFTPPQISWTMVSTGVSNFTITIDGIAVVVDMSGESSGSWILDYARKRLTKDTVGQPQLIDLTATEGWPEVKRNSTYVRSGTTGSTGTTLTYREAWV